MNNLKEFKELVLKMERAAARGEDTNPHKDELIRFFADPSTLQRMRIRAAGWMAHRVISRRRLAAAEEAEREGIRAIIRLCERES